jgi:hypothetical protein
MKPYRPNWVLIGVCAVLAAVVLAVAPIINRRVSATVVNKVQDALYEDAKRGLAAANTEYDRWLRLTEIVGMEVGRTAPDEVRSHANEVLAIATKYPNDWNYGNAIHKANLARGRLALREGRIDEAGDYLVKAGNTPGSPQLDSAGPNMVLAKELLEKGQRAKVLEYFTLCGKFWKSDHGQLKEWSEEVKAGKEPEFGASLLY